MKKHLFVLLVLSVTLLSADALRAATPIIDAAGLANASNEDGTYYVLKDGEWVIYTATIDISGAAINSLKVNSAGSSLTLDADTNSLTTPPLTIAELELGAGSITALGGDDTSARGLYVTNDVRHHGTGTLTVKGGKSGTGMLVDGDYSLSASGTIIAYGGIKTDSADSHGLYISGKFDQTGESVVSAFGGVGSGDSQHGFYVGKDFTQNGNGVINATGGSGSGDSQYGFVVSGSFTQNDDGVINATGGSGSGDYQHGFVVSGNFTQNGNGVINATGGSGTSDQQSGFFIGGDLIQRDNGSINAKGGSGSGFYQRGIFLAGNFTQEGRGSAIVIGGSGNGGNQTGLFVGNIFSQDSEGTVRAIGGTGTGGIHNRAAAVGLFCERVATFNGTLFLERQAKAASAYFFNVESGNTTSFTATSVVVPVVDLAKTDGNLASGLILAHKVVSITPGATLRPEFANTLQLGLNEKRDDILFMNTNTGDYGVPDNAGTIDGEFTLAARQTMTLRLDAEKRESDKEYYLSVERFAHADDVAAAVGGDGARNTANLLRAIRQGVPGQTGAAADFLGQIYSNFDNAATSQELLDLAGWTARAMTPQQATRIPIRALNRQDAALLDFSRNLQLLPVGVKTSGSAAALASIADCGAPWRVWANPVFQKTSSRSAETREYDSADEWFAGLALGMGRDFDRMSLGVNAHYFRGDVDASGYDASSDTFGLTLGARFRDLVPGGGRFNPWVEALAGYARENIDQKRYDALGNSQRSKPHVDLFSASLTVGNEFRPSACLSVTPLAGLEYAHVRQDSYRERGAGPLGLSIRADNHDSLRLKAGVEARYAVNDRLDVSARAVYRYEALDRETRLTSAFNALPAVRFVTHGERLNRSSGNLGVGLGYRLSDSARLTAGYDCWLADNYVAHQGSVSISVGF